MSRAADRAPDGWDWAEREWGPAIPFAERTAALAAFEVRVHGGLIGRGVVLGFPQLTPRGFAK